MFITSGKFWSSRNASRWAWEKENIGEEGGHPIGCDYGHINQINMLQYGLGHGQRVAFSTSVCAVGRIKQLEMLEDYWWLFSSIWGLHVFIDLHFQPVNMLLKILQYTCNTKCIYITFLHFTWLCISSQMATKINLILILLVQVDFIPV